MKINSKILHLPPFISTTWPHIRALFLKGQNLVISLTSGTVVEIPNLKPEDFETIFNAHSSFIEGQQNQGVSEHLPSLHLPHPKANSLLPLKTNSEAENDPYLSFGLGTFDSFGSALHHNASQANMPDLPKEILNKITAIAKIVAPDDPDALPKPEPHCNCTHCQIAKAVQQGLEKELKISTSDKESEDEVTDADLVFQQWEIMQSGEKLYSVSNRLDTKEKYSVYLGQPLGCTCGKQGCEHILAVLKS